MVEKKFNEQEARLITSGEKLGKIKTKGGRPARIVCWDAMDSKPIVALVKYGVEEVPSRHTTGGKYDARENVDSNFDLIIETEGGEA